MVVHLPKIMYPTASFSGDLQQLMAVKYYNFMEVRTGKVFKNTKNLHFSETCFIISLLHVYESPWLCYIPGGDYIT